MIYADNEHVGSITYSTGPIANMLCVDVFNIFTNVVLIELIQTYCTEKLYYFNIVFAKKFEFENKLNVNSKSFMVSVLTSWIDARLNKLKLVQNQTGDGKIYNSLPYLKMYYYSKYRTKYFNNSFKLAQNLNAGDAIFTV